MLNFKNIQNFLRRSKYLLTVIPSNYNRMYQFINKIYLSLKTEKPSTKY